MLAVFSTSYPVRSAAPPGDPLVRIHYDLELASYCSLITASVKRGFQRQLALMVRGDNISGETLRQARHEASVAVYREWQNRGLGGFRNWCRTDGAASVRRFATDTQE